MNKDWVFFKKYNLFWVTLFVCVYFSSFIELVPAAVTSGPTVSTPAVGSELVGKAPVPDAQIASVASSGGAGAPVGMAYPTPMAGVEQQGAPGVEVVVETSSQEPPESGVGATGGEVVAGEAGTGEAVVASEPDKPGESVAGQAATPADAVSTEGAVAEDGAQEDSGDSGLIEFPLLGSFSFDKTKTVIPGQVQEKKAFPHPDPKKTFDLGFVRVVQPVLTQRSEGLFGIEGEISLFDIKVGKASLKEFLPGERALISVSLVKPLEVSLFGTTKVAVSDIDLDFSSEFVARTKVLLPGMTGEGLELAFSKPADDVVATCKLPALSVASIIPPLGGTPVDKLIFSDAELTVQSPFGTQGQQLSVAGNLDCAGLASTLGIPVNLGKLASVARLDPDGTFGFDAYLAPGDELNPFAVLPGMGDLPIVRDITIKNLRVTLDSQKTLILQGDASFFGVTVEARVGKSGGSYILRLKIPGEVNLVDKIPLLKATPFGLFSLGNPVVILSSGEYYDPDSNIKLYKGISVAGEVAIESSPFAPLKLLFKMLPEKITVAGTVGATPESTRVQGALQLGMQIGKLAQIRNVILEVSGGPAVAFMCQIEVTPPGTNDKLLFTGRAAVSVRNVTVSGTMEGKWRPFGLPLEMSDMAVEVGIEPPVFASTGLPSIFGMAGAIQVGDVKIATAAKVSADMSELVLLGKVNKLGLKEILSLIRVPAPNIPVLELEDVEMMVAPKDTMIGVLMFQQGLTFKGTLFLLGAKAFVDTRVDKDKIKIAGGVSKIKLGELLEMSGNSKEGGPFVDILVSPAEQHARMSGKIKFFGLTSESDMVIQRDQFSFSTQTKFLGLFDVKFTGKSIGSGRDLDFVIKGEGQRATLKLSKDDLTKVRDQVKRKIDELEADINKGAVASKIRAAQKVVSDAQSKVDSLQREIDSTKRELEKNPFAYNLIDEYNYILDHEDAPHVRNLITKAIHIENMHDFYEQYNDDGFTRRLLAWDWFRRACRSVSRGVSSAARSVGSGVSKAATTVSKGVTKAATTVGKGVATAGVAVGTGVVVAAQETKKGVEKGVDVVKKIAGKGPLSAKLAGLYTAYGVAKGALFAAEKALDVLKRADPTIWDKMLLQLAMLPVLGAVEGAIVTYPAVNWLILVEVKKVTVEASMRSPLPKFSVTVQAFGTLEKTITISTRPDQFFDALKNEIINMASQIKGIFK